MTKFCLYCSTKLGVHQHKYCSNNHQRLHQGDLLIAKWKETGIAKVGSHQHHYIREYLKQKQNDCCAICGLNSQWKGSPLNFIIDHIDGNSNNSSESNLRLVCPNCDSQLPTYKGKTKDLVVTIEEFATKKTSLFNKASALPTELCGHL
jgi:hypothetical protein